MENIILCHPRASSGQNPNQGIVVKCDVPQTIPKDHVLLEVDRFGFSANNVTYQALGEASHFRSASPFLSPHLSRSLYLDILIFTTFQRQREFPRKRMV